MVRRSLGQPTTARRSALVEAICRYFANPASRPRRDLLLSGKCIDDNGEPSGDQIHWEISDGVGNRRIRYSSTALKLFQVIRERIISTDAEPGKQYTAVVMDNTSVADATVIGEYYTYPIWAWMLLFAALIACLIVSIWLPYAAFGSAIAGGFLLLLNCA